MYKSKCCHKKYYIVLGEVLLIPKTASNLYHIKAILERSKQQAAPWGKEAKRLPIMQFRKNANTSSSPIYFF